MGATVKTTPTKPACWGLCCVCAGCTANLNAGYSTAIDHMQTNMAQAVLRKLHYPLFGPLLAKLRRVGAAVASGRA